MRLALEIAHMLCAVVFAVSVVHMLYRPIRMMVGTDNHKIAFDPNPLVAFTHRDWGSIILVLSIGGLYLFQWLLGP